MPEHAVIRTVAEVMSRPGLTTTGGVTLSTASLQMRTEGIGALDAALVRAMMDDPSPRMRVQAIRASETLYKAGDPSFADDYRRLARDARLAGGYSYRPRWRDRVLAWADAELGLGLGTLTPAAAARRAPSVR